MEKSLTKSIMQLLEMSPEDRESYLRALPESEQKAVGKELLKAKAGDTVKKLVNNLNSNSQTE